MKLNNNDDSHNSGLNLLIYNMLLDIESHPAWVCGLKHLVFPILLPFAQSHPAWVCGLKRGFGSISRTDAKSHPAWVCGLKHVLQRIMRRECFVTPCVGVWIETHIDAIGTRRYISHTLRGCVD